MNSTDLCFTPALELASAIRSGDISPSDAVDAVLSRIDALEPKVNAMTIVMGEHAREAAKAAEQALADGVALGPLHGVYKSLWAGLGVPAISKGL